MLEIFLFSLLSLTHCQTIVKILSCDASLNQAGYHCSYSVDGVFTGSTKGWAINGEIPQHVNYTLEKSVYLDQLRIISAVDRSNLHVTGFILQIVKRI